MVHVWSTKTCDEWGEINNVREWGRFKVHHKADRNEFLSAYSGTTLSSVDIMYTINIAKQIEWCADEWKIEWSVNGV